MHGNQQKPQWYDYYRYTGRDLKMYWNRNGGRICSIAGTTGLFLTGAHACRKTYKIHDKLKGNGERIKAAKGKSRGSGVKEFIISSAKTAKDYLPDIIGGALSAYLVQKGWGQEHHNYQEATAMVGIIAGSFMDYRKNVIAEHGVEADRRYLTTKREDKKVLSATLEDGTKLGAAKNEASDGEGIVVNADPNLLKIWYSKETTPNVWSPSHLIRMQHLETITDNLNRLLICGGHYTVNDVRREFYGVKGDKPAGAIFGRVWDPGNPAHPERGGKVNLHYEDDEDFKYGLTDSCWIIIDIDDEPLIESLAVKEDGVFPGIEI